MDDIQLSIIWERRDPRLSIFLDKATVIAGQSEETTKFLDVNVNGPIKDNLNFGAIHLHTLTRDSVVQIIHLCLTKKNIWIIWKKLSVALTDLEPSVQMTEVVELRLTQRLWL